MEERKAKGETKVVGLPFLLGCFPFFFFFLSWLFSCSSFPLPVLLLRCSEWHYKRLKKRDRQKNENDVTSLCLCFFFFFFFFFAF